MKILSHTDYSAIIEFNDRQHEITFNDTGDFDTSNMHGMTLEQVDALTDAIVCSQELQQLFPCE